MNAAVRPEAWERAPARSFTAVEDMLPPFARPPRKQQPTLAAPMARSSRSGFRS